MNLREEVKAELTEHIIPFWEGLRDEEKGGYYGYMDFELQVDKAYEKGCILNSRILWFFANAYLTLGENRLLEDARHAYEFMMNFCRDKELGGVYWSVTCNGKAADTTKHTYNQAFAIYALSSYYDATKSEEALAFAIQLFHLIEENCRDEYGYLESFTRDWKPEDNDKLSENGLLADKTMNTLLHVLEAYTELYRICHKEEVGQALQRILQDFREKVYRTDLCRLEVFFDKEMNSISDLYSYGHDIEASWLLDRAAEVLQDEEILRKTQEYTTEIAEAVCKAALDGDAMNNECFRGQVDTTRVWWVQAEAIVGFLNCYQKTGHKKYFEIAEQLWNYIKKYIIDKREGSEWFWDLNREQEPESRKPIVEPWKCPYHNGRMCMEIIKRMDLGGNK